MAGKSKISKDNVITAAVEIIRKEGIECLNARRLAKELGCSTQPIFYVYANMEEVKSEVLDRISKDFYDAIFVRNYNVAAYKDIAVNYIRFAKEQTNLFKFLFNHNNNETLKSFVNLTGPASEVKNILAKQTGLPDEEAKRFHMGMWLFVNGIANLVANNTYEFKDEELESILTESYFAQVLYEVHKGNMSKDKIDMFLKNKLEKR